MPDSLLKAIVLGEVNGKNLAIHAYDRMVWTVRSGFLTLFFGGWGLLLKTLVEIPTLGTRHYAVVGALLIMSMSVAAGAMVIDMNYVRRKFRVIAALNGLMEELARVSDRELETAASLTPTLASALSVAGDSDSKRYRIPGYPGERAVGVLIYTIPVIAVAVGLAIIAAVDRG